MGSLYHAAAPVDAQVSGIRWQDSPRRCIPNCGCRGIIPLPGAFEGAAPPQGFDFGFTPLRGHHGARGRFSSTTRRGTENPRRGVGGRGGSAPCRRANVKIGAPKLAFASAKPTLTVEIFAHEFPSLGGESNHPVRLRRPPLQGRGIRSSLSSSGVVATTMTVEEHHSERRLFRRERELLCFHG
jgi:hypothetical protein